eukprot:Sspe_Gene.103956::Locus_79834_Transcript_1_2_Confidence_0.667_Length_1333::g.103956::m.103956
MVECEHGVHPRECGVPWCKGVPVPPSLPPRAQNVLRRVRESRAAFKGTYPERDHLPPDVLRVVERIEGKLEVRRGAPSTDAVGCRGSPASELMGLRVGDHVVITGGERLQGRIPLGSRGVPEGSVGEVVAIDPMAVWKFTVEVRGKVVVVGRGDLRPATEAEAVNAVRWERGEKGADHAVHLPPQLGQWPRPVLPLVPKSVDQLTPSEKVAAQHSVRFTAKVLSLCDSLRPEVSRLCAQQRKGELLLAEAETAIRRLRDVTVYSPDPTSILSTRTADAAWEEKQKAKRALEEVRDHSSLLETALARLFTQMLSLNSRAPPLTPQGEEDLLSNEAFFLDVLQHMADEVRASTPSDEGL